MKKIVLLIGALVIGFSLKAFYFSNGGSRDDQVLQNKNSLQENSTSLNLQEAKLSVVGFDQPKDVETALTIEENEPNQSESTSTKSSSAAVSLKQNRIASQTTVQRKNIVEQNKLKLSHLLRKHSVPELPRDILSKLSAEQLYSFANKFYGQHLSHTESKTLIDLARGFSSGEKNGDLRLLSLASSLERNQREMDLLRSKQISEGRKSNQQTEELGLLSKINMNGNIEELKKQFTQSNQRLVRYLVNEISRNTVSVNENLNKEQ